MMFATRGEGMTITMSDDIARALAGFDGGYTVRLHGLPGFVFEVDAETADKAHAAALAAARKEGYCLRNAGADVQGRDSKKL
ncbi:MAG TPA: hypothetical protein VLM89_07825 [Phycisphaerae bacterium]|nr:hypothetical protein [Phycisphaerae bacterium]